MSSQEQLSRAYRYCGWITTRHYENFPVGSWLLPKPVRPHVAAVYAFARSADDFADEARYHGRSLELLDQWRTALWDSVRPSTLRQAQGERSSGRSGNAAVRAELVEARMGDHPIFIALADTVRRHNLPVQLLDDLLTAFIMDVTKRRYDDWPDLMNYCKHSANPVGRLVLLLSGIREEELHARSDDICSALQLANHWQDLAVDLARDIIYIPQDMLRSFGVTEPDLNCHFEAERPRNLALQNKISRRFAARDDIHFKALMKDLVTRTRALFDSGEPLVKHLKGGLRLEIKLTLLGGRTILDRIEAAGYDVFNHRPVISTFDKMGLLTRALFSRSP